MRHGSTTAGRARGAWGGALAGALLALSGCAGEDLSGFYFNLTVSGIEDGCTGEPASFSEKVEYRVKIEGQEVELAVGPDVFATGSVNGCVIQYQSVVWGEVIERNGSEYEIRWILEGSAEINPGKGSCTPDNGTDWDGVERFEVVNSEDPEISPGCSYDVALAGKFTGEK